MRNELITYTDPKSSTSEMFRTLRTNLQFMSNSKKLQTVLITSTLPEEGKSWVSSNLAVTFAQAGKKVVLVDADMRKGRQFAIFNVIARPGLSNYLSGVVNDGEVRDVDNILSYVRGTGVQNLYVVPAGDVPPNPSELLINDRMSKLLSDLKQEFDFIIFDAPPALLVTDATILSKLLDTTMIVVAHQETKMDNLNKVQKAIKNVGGNVAGVVINKIPISVKKYQDSYYGGYYADEKDIEKSKNSNKDLYLRGKATILDDRNKQISNQQTNYASKPIQSKPVNTTANPTYQNMKFNTQKTEVEPIKKSTNVVYQNFQPKEQIPSSETFKGIETKVQPNPSSAFQNINQDKVEKSFNFEKQEESMSAMNKTQELLSKMKEQLEQERKNLNNQ